MAASSFPFFELPSEIRELVYTEIFIPEANRYKDDDGYLHYNYDLRLLRANRRMHNESRVVFMKLNPLVAIETPWEQAPTHTQVEGYVPVLMTGDQARHYQHHVMTVRVDAPSFNASSPEAERFLVHVDQLTSFCEFWNYQDVSNPRLNQHLRLDLHLKNATWQTEETEQQPLKRSLQKALMEPFGLIKHLKEVFVRGPRDDGLEKAMREKMTQPNTPAEECLDEALRLKDLGNKVLMEDKDSWGAVKLYQESFLALHIVCDGRRRSEWGDVFFQREMKYGKHKGQAGGLARLLLRVKLVANIIFAYVRMADKTGYRWAHFWGMRTINLLRTADEDEIEEPLLDFPAANELGKIYFRTAVASKHLNHRDEARNLLRVAMAYLPNDPQVKAEFADVQGVET